MSKSKTNFSFFSSFIVRTPRYPISFYQNLTKELVIRPDEIKKKLKDRDILEAIFLASPELYREIQKHLIKEDWDDERASKIKASVLKYLIRMSTRCTPFGLFAACGIGKLDNKTKIQINNSQSHRTIGFYRKTRLDMQLLGNLGYEYANNPTIQKVLLLYPNTTLYKLVNFYRYIQYTINEGKRIYSLEGFKRTKYLDLIMEKARYGINKEDLKFILISKKISENEAIEFINELIAHQILVYETELNLTGDDYLNRLMNLVCSLKKSDGLHSEELLNSSEFEKEQIEDWTLFLKKISNTLIEIDRLDCGKKILEFYEKIAKTITSKGVSFDKKYLFQTDLFLNNSNYSLNKKYTQDINKAISFLNKISEKPKDSLLENFKKRFIERYDEEMIPLVKALDVETGIGYVQGNNFDITPLLDTIEIKQEPKEDFKVHLSKVEKIILDKLQYFGRENKNRVRFKFSDFENIDFSNENLPTTFSCVFEVVEEDDKEWVVIHNIGGSSAANLLARFCYGNEDIDHFANEITKYELDSFGDKIIAEIVHLPENRTGNVLRRPNFRCYEIPYLGQSSLPFSKQINIEDIMLFIDNGRLKMWSRINNKEIIPRLTNAHNYSYNSLPIYQFLCDMQFENCKPSVGINHFKIDKMLDYSPRIIIENCIVSKEKWIFTREKQQVLFEKFKEENLVYDRSIFNLELYFSGSRPPLPQYVSLVDDDNTLIVNLENRTSIEILVKSVKNKTHFVLEEYLFPSKKLVNDVEGNYYGNQFIVGLKWQRE
ncbi:lantibiotic dehydratase family protein [Flavobacterium sp. ov086]|uniref:lantibiotic dehydratase family protein n=1 Tax=Flavobacterium sp. ov086 TaxID=1761785 RepID=UPI000B677E71|nr:lantibiotic dehydratase family protein [Flavobacterium sp. ov086]SNR95196.1 Lantibiotic dehydratase, C terminus [Flavobacterium sp. ov086]